MNAFLCERYKDYTCPCSFLGVSSIKEHVLNLWAFFLCDLENRFPKLHGGLLGFFNLKNTGSKISVDSIDEMISGTPFITNDISQLSFSV